jgi:hypothetical protein
MAVTESIEITPGRYFHLVHIKFNMKVRGISLFHHNLMDEKNSRGDVVVQHALCTIDDLLNLHDTIQRYLFAFIEDIKNMEIEEESKSNLKKILGEWRDEAVKRGEKIKSELDHYADN